MNSIDYLIQENNHESEARIGAYNDSRFFIEKNKQIVSKGKMKV